MHLLHFPDTPEVAAMPNVDPGSSVCLDVNGAEFLLAHQALKPTLTPYDGGGLNPTDKRVLILGTMGFGDALMLTPVLREMKRREPLLEIHLCCFEQTRQVFFNLPYVDGFLDYPPRLSAVQEFGTLLTIEHAVEHNMLAQSQHMTDRFAQHLGLCTVGEEWTADKKPDFIMSSQEKEWVEKSFPRNEGKRRLGLQVQAGMRCRTYPISQIMSQVVKGGFKQGMLDNMIKDGWEIALLGLPGEFMTERTPNGVLDMTRFGLTFRQSVGFLTTCDAFLGPDSSLMHAAGTLDIPGVGLFGPIDMKLRIAYYDSIFGMDGRGVCPMAPCGHTYHSGLPQFPLDGPCAKDGVCTELAAIKPDGIRYQLEKLAPIP